MAFTDYEQMPSGLVRFQDDQGQWTPGFLPTVGQVGMWRSQIDAQRAAAPPPAAAPAPEVPMQAAPVPDALVAAQAPAMQRRAFSGDQGAQGAGSGAEAEPLPANGGAGGAPQGAPAAPMSQGAGGGGGAPGAAPADPTQAGAGPIAKVGDGGGAAGPVSDADRDRATAAALHRQRAMRLLQGTPGVYDPGGERLTGYSQQRSGMGTTEALRMNERAAAMGIPPAVLERTEARFTELDQQLGALTTAMQKAKTPKQKADLAGRIRELAPEYQRLRSVFGRLNDQLPPGMDALADLEREQQRGAAVDERLAGVDAEQAEKTAAALAEREQVRAAEAAKAQAFYDRRNQELGDVYGKIEAKRQEYEKANVDPNRLWKNMDTGRTVAAALFTALGSFGQVLAGDRGPSQSVAILQQAVDADIRSQVADIDKKGKELGQLAEVYSFAKDKFGSEEAGLAAARIAALDAIDAKIDRFVAEAGTERARLGGEKLKAMNQERRMANRFVVDQAALGQRTDAVRVDQPGWRGGSGPNEKGAAEALEAAAKLGDTGDQQQVFYNGTPHVVGKFVSPSEGADARKKLNLVNALRAEINAAQKLRGVLGTDWMKSQEFKDHANTIAGMRSILIEQGVLQGNEREEFQGLANSLLSGSDVLTNVGKMSDRLARGYMDQLQAKPVGTGRAQPWFDPSKVGGRGGTGPAAPAGGKKGGSVTVTSKTGGGAPIKPMLSDGKR